jgi:ATP-dependent helicase/nuclease subunit A
VPAPTPRELADDGRFLRGTLTHALLEHLPTLSADRWPVAARRFVAIRGERLSARQRASIVAETLKVLADPQFAAVFGPQSRAEVPIVAELADPAGRQPPARIAGQIDRLVRLGTQTLIIDYKTSRPSPSKAADIPVAYLCQLAAYRLALRAVFPGTDVQAAILWTDGPRLMAVPPAALDAHESVLWELGSPSPGAKD